MRAHSELGGGGNWSEAVIISNKDISKEKTCTTPPSPSATNPKPLKSDDESSNSKSSDTYVPVLGAVGAIIGLILLVLLMALTVVCGRIHRRKKRIQHVLARQVGGILHFHISAQEHFP